MTPSHRLRVESLFAELADEPPDRRAALLDAACAGDDALRADVEALLEADAAGHPLLDAEVGRLADALLDVPPGQVPPERFGRYVLQSLLDEGGMGAVYLARRDDLDDVVAVKFLRDAWSSPARRHRFASEQRTLAALTHPNIARLYDAGVAGDTPWFAMEYVRGATNIVAYCVGQRLDLRQRLALFRSACDAVSYAHRHLTVHLDLKPSNVLVDSDGQVRLVDFGIARHLTAVDGLANPTVTAHRALSLNYASPEQIRGEPLDVQTDVYALGAVLYELLTGTPAASAQSLTAEQIARWLDEEPPRPSLAASPSRLELARTQWKDLDLLCVTAMQKRKAERYQTVDRLMVDLDHFLNDEPLEARREGLGSYRLRKFVVRHRRAVAVAAAMVLLVTGLSVFFTARLVDARDRAQASEARAQQINRVMLSLFEGDDSVAGPAGELRVVSLLDRGVREAEGLNDPALRAELRYTLGGLYHKLGHLDRADPLLTAAWTEQTQLLGATALPTLRARLALVGLRVEQGRFEDAETIARGAREAAVGAYPAESFEVAAATAMLGKVLTAQGNYAAAVPLLEESMKVLLQRPDSMELAEALGDLTNARYYMGDVAAAEALSQQGLALDRRLFGDRHPHVAIDLYNLANIRLDRANYREAERLYREALGIDVDWYGEKHPKTATSALMVGRALAYQGRADDARTFYERAMTAFRSVYPDTHVRVGSVFSLMGDLARDQGRFDEADRDFEQAAAIFKAVAGERHEFYLHQMSNLGSVLVARGRYVEAEAVLRRALDGLVAAVPQQRYTAIAGQRLAAALAGQGKNLEAESGALKAYQALLTTTSPGAAEVQEARRTLVAIYTALDRPADARRFQTELDAHAVR
jgi:serine/threonine-protein kinase